jgi:hypothetical protein
MATTDVLIRDELGLRVPSVLSVPAVSGNGITFTAVQGADSTLYFSPETAAILEPSPEARVSLPAGAAASYKFATVGPGVYGVIIQSPGDTSPAGFDFGGPADPPALVIQPGSGVSFPGPIVPIKTGG